MKKIKHSAGEIKLAAILTILYHLLSYLDIEKKHANFLVRVFFLDIFDKFKYDRSCESRRDVAQSLSSIQTHPKCKVEDHNLYHLERLRVIFLVTFIEHMSL